MKKIFNITKGVFIALALSASVVSCSEDMMDSINKNNNNTTDVDSKFILADVITSTAFNVVGGDMNTYSSIYVEHEVGVDNQTYRAEHRESEPSAASTLNNTWGACYRALKDARIVIDKCSAGGSQEGNDVTKGIAEVLAALNSAIITDAFGDAPWSEASLINPDGTPKIMNPKIDTQKDIYIGIMQYLDNAIVDLQGTDAHGSGPIGSYDLLYGGDYASWLKLAYGLKARYTMRQIKRSTSVATDMANVLSYLDKSFTSATQQAAFNIYGASNLNPLFDFQWSRDGLGASKSMSEKLIERNDPRLRRVFVDPDRNQLTGEDDDAFFMAPNGENEERKFYYNTSVFVFSQTAPTMLMSYHEVLFLRAEALCRLNRENEAKAVLKNAVIAAIANTEVGVRAAFNAPTVIDYYGEGLIEKTSPITTFEAEQYFDNDVLPLFTANPLKEVMIQKYISFFGASGESTECYSDLRRLKGLNENFIELKNPVNTTKFPLRFPYGSDDTTANPEVGEAYGDGTYVYSDKVWWAGGTR